MRRNCRTYLTQISIRFASNYGRSAHTRCRKERAPEESTSHRATYLFIFCAPRLLWKNVTSQRATYLLILLRQQNYLRTTSHLWRCRKERAPEGSKSHRATHLSIFFARKNIFDEKRNLGVEAKKRKSCRTCLIQISLRFASKTSTLTTFSIVLGYRL